MPCRIKAMEVDARSRSRAQQNFTACSGWLPAEEFSRSATKMIWRVHKMNHTHNVIDALALERMVELQPRQSPKHQNAMATLTKTTSEINAVNWLSTTLNPYQLCLVLEDRCDVVIGPHYDAAMSNATAWKACATA